MADPKQFASETPRPPGKPTPEDPRQREPIHDPPVHPEHDPGEREPVREAGGVAAPDPAPDEVLFDENESGR